MSLYKSYLTGSSKIFCLQVCMQDRFCR